jgi:hypothetical protein
MGLHRPADNPAAERVEHHGQVEEAGPGRDVGYIGDPQAIGRGGREVALDQIRRGARPGVVLGGGCPVAPAYALKPARAHQPGHPLASYPNALLLKFRVDARRAVGGARAAMNLGDAPAQLGVHASARRCRALKPRVITAGGGAQHAAHSRNRMHGLVGSCEGERR